MSGDKTEKLKKGAKQVKAKKFRERKHYRGLLGVGQDLLGAVLGNPDIHGERS